MKININEITAKVQIVKGKHENLLANASIALKTETGQYFTISGFSVWKSKFEGAPLNVSVPQNRNFKYCLFEGMLWKQISKEILEEYDKADIANYIEDHEK